MRYDLSRFKSGTDHIDRTYEPAAFGAESEDFRITSPVHLTADLTKSGAKFLLKGRLTATLELACSRCLEMFEVPVHFYSVSPEQVKRTTVVDGIRSMATIIAGRVKRPSPPSPASAAGSQRPSPSPSTR